MYSHFDTHGIFQPTRLTPYEVHGIERAKSVALGEHDSCAVLENGETLCWGICRYGTEGACDPSHPNEIPVPILGIEPVDSIAAGKGHFCAVLKDRRVKCWGENDQGQLGNGHIGILYKPQLIPTEVTGLPPVQTVALGEKHSCALTDTGDVYCWGGNDRYQLESGSTQASASPLKIQALSAVRAISANAEGTFAVLENQELVGWGGRHSITELIGPRLPGSGIPIVLPIKKWNPFTLPRMKGVEAVAEAGSHTCALMVQNQIRCWGDNSDGELGDGTFRSRWFPSVIDLTH
jgi:alpha-tubulin suppressor-like RCC1 family protein